YRRRLQPAATVPAALAPADSLPDGRGDVAGLGARRVILSLFGRRPPYTLGATLNVNDRFLSPAKLDAGQWYRLALTREPNEGPKWRVRLYLDGRQVHEGVSEKFTAPANIPPSLILGAELFYMHSSYYRGLIGRTTVFDRALGAAEIAAMK